MDRSEKANIGGKEYDLVLTVLAQKEIAKKYGGLENLSEELDGAEGIEAAVWFITLLANQGIMIDNLWSNEKKPLLTETEVELLVTPGQFQDLVPKLEAAIEKGMKRHVASEEDNVTGGAVEKNAQTG